MERVIWDLATSVVPVSQVKCIHCIVSLSLSRESVHRGQRPRPSELAMSDELGRIRREKHHSGCCSNRNCFRNDERLLLRTRLVKWQHSNNLKGRKANRAGSSLMLNIRKLQKPQYAVLCPFCTRNGRFLRTQPIKK